MAIDFATKSDAEIAKLIAQCLKFRSDPKRGEMARERLADCLAEAKRRASDKSGFVPMLAAMGYNARHKQLTAQERADILGNILHSELPFLNSDQFMAAWGQPGTKERLREMYRTIRLYRDKFGWQIGDATRKWDDDLNLLENFAIEKGWMVAR